MAKRAAKQAEASAPQEPPKRGRPTEYTPEIAREILERLSTGRESLRTICESEHLPAESTVRGWVIDDREGFSAHYERARNLGLDAMADETLEIADDGRNDWMQRQTGDGETVTVVDHEHVTRSRLRVDTRKWYLAKLAPKRYGEKITQELTGKDGAPLVPVLNVSIGNKSKSAS